MDLVKRIGGLRRSMDSLRGIILRKRFLWITANAHGPRQLVRTIRRRRCFQGRSRSAISKLYATQTEVDLMASNEYAFLTHWRVPGTLEQAYAILIDVRVIFVGGRTFILKSSRLVRYPPASERRHVF